jgi:hypothetical protein
MATLPALAALLAVAAGCAPDIDGAQQWAGAPFGADRVVEMGPLQLGESQAVEPLAGALRGKLPGFRVESFGGTELDIDLWGAQATLFVQGPLPGPDGDDLGPAPIIAEAGAEYDAGAHLKGVRLATPGVYRVVVADRAALATGGPLERPLTLSARCTSGLACEHPFLRSPPASLGKYPSVYGVAAYAAQDAVTLAMQWRTPTGQLGYAKAMAAYAAWTKTSESPVSEVHSLFLSTLLNLSDLDGTGPPAQPLGGDLTQLLGACDLLRPHPVPVSGPYAVGSFPDLGLTRCQVARSVRLAAVLNSLALYGRAEPYPLSDVRYRGGIFSQVHELVSALLEAGHRIELIEERSLARATTVSVDGKEVFWPVWMNTGFVLGNGKELRMPLGRSRIVWRISGPDVNARIALGCRSGLAEFVPQLDRPPGWVGRRPAEVSTDPALVVESFRAATHYMTRDHEPPQTPRMSHSFGTSSDAAAALRRGVFDEVDDTLPFPLLRTRNADRHLPPNTLIDPIDRRLADMPHDYDASKKPGWSTDQKTNRDGLRRLYNMMPFATDSAMLDVFPPSVRRGMCVLEGNAGQPVSSACRSIMHESDLR